MRSMCLVVKLIYLFRMDPNFQLVSGYWIFIILTSFSCRALPDSLLFCLFEAHINAVSSSSVHI